MLNKRTFTIGLQRSSLQPWEQLPIQNMVLSGHSLAPKNNIVVKNVLSIECYFNELKGKL